ncbi:Alpha/Beta hydrolase protein [Lobosporangium transversale]|uniref:sn-1-specific diacylglycerol lipase n=1 Tax=Lobosporangium transversale TaxID=64571 RepID=A0A1Y2GMA9_9FUNG|nr:Alpha/Beta hydrolase protein [Lobosporangium transversale]ORZ15417.1 Alpha/Beta hydrolase protein [Lobosporangium transversale]|eukprot:XP_021881165.1 Alpha/Beta hydrolase protein [Lobosporangium transversale]
MKTKKNVFVGKGYLKLADLWETIEDSYNTKANSDIAGDHHGPPSSSGLRDYVIDIELPLEPKSYANDTMTVINSYPFRMVLGSSQVGFIAVRATMQLELKPQITSYQYGAYELIHHHTLAQSYFGNQEDARMRLFINKNNSAMMSLKALCKSFFRDWNLSLIELFYGCLAVEEYLAASSIPKSYQAFCDIEMLEHAHYCARMAVAAYGTFTGSLLGYHENVTDRDKDIENVLQAFNLKKEDMIAWHYHCKIVGIASYYIIRDPRHGALCVVIRGTASFSDAVTNLLCKCESYKGGFVHQGMMENARSIIFNHFDTIMEALRQFNLSKVYCIGHSLGAGTASLLCSLLQDRFAEPQVRARLSSEQGQKLQVMARLFAPPPVCSPDLATEFEHNQIAFVNENDLVCRLSYTTADHLKTLIKQAASELAYQGDKSVLPLPSPPQLFSFSRRLSNNSRLMGALERTHGELHAFNKPKLVLGGKIVYLYKGAYSVGSSLAAEGPVREVRAEYSHHRHFSTIHFKRNSIAHHSAAKYEVRIFKALKWARSQGPLPEYICRSY